MNVSIGSSGCVFWVFIVVAWWALIEELWVTFELLSSLLRMKGSEFYLVISLATERGEGRNW
jgi:hypothetical protein